MALIRWAPARELNTIQHEMNRLFNTLVDAPAPGNARSGALPRWIPAMDLVEAGNDFVLRADLPGLSEGDVKIELEDNVLTISGERKTEHADRREGYYRVERASGHFVRSLTLPEGVDPEGFHGSFDNGVLEVRIPKPEERKPHKVAISLGSRPRGDEGKTIDASPSPSQEREAADAGAASPGAGAAA